MSVLDDEHAQSQPRQRRKQPTRADILTLHPESDSSTELDKETESMPNLNQRIAAVSSSLDSIHIPPRTPRSHRISNNEAIDEVELSLLTEEERKEAELANGYGNPASTKSKPMSGKDKRAIALLILLCKCNFVWKFQC